MAGEPSSTVGDQSDSFPLRQLTMLPKCEAVSIAPQRAIPSRGTKLSHLVRAGASAVTVFLGTKVMKPKGESCKPRAMFSGTVSTWSRFSRNRRLVLIADN
jgi:hypothetical protein